MTPMVLLAQAGDDPTAMLLAAAGACISALASALGMVVWGQIKQLRRDFASLSEQLTGAAGMYTRIVTLEGQARTLSAEVEALKKGSLTREMFEWATRDQNSKLDDLRSQNRELSTKVDGVERVIHQTIGRAPSPYPRPSK